jgi:hypothetical protein
MVVKDGSGMIGARLSINKQPIGQPQWKFIDIIELIQARHPNPPQHQTSNHVDKTPLIVGELQSFIILRESRVESN